MPIQILMPALSPTMTEGNLAKWNVKEGDTVTSGDVIAEIETDKATMELEAVDEGVIGKILVEQGAKGVAVNTPIAVLLLEGEDASAISAPAQAKPQGGRMPEPPAAMKPQAEAPLPPEKTGSVPTQPDVSAAAAGLGFGMGGFSHLEAPAGGRVFASPLARRIAADAKLDLARIKGSGPKGRIVKADVEAAKAGGGAPSHADAELEAAMALAAAIVPPASKAAPQAAPKPAQPAPDVGTPYEEKPHSSMRKVIARRLTESSQQVPQFYVTMDVVLDELLALREKINARGGAKVSVNDFVIRACALALKKMPECNVSWTDDAMRMYSRSDVSVAVATPTGLITPIVRGAESKSLGKVSEEMRELAGRARDGKLKPEEYQGGTFSVSNLGMFGVKHFTGIINPPQALLLAVGAGEQRPMVRDGAIAIVTAMTVTLTCDHRCIDGALGAKFLGVVKDLLEDPMSILL